MPGSLSTEQQAAYARDGYLCPIDIFTPEQAAPERALLEGLESGHSANLPRKVSEYLRVASYVATDVPLRVVGNQKVLDAVESVLGPDILLWSCEYFIKEANSTQIVSWHQDLTYWGMDGTDHEVTAWIALSPATAASGCMKFVPGSHKESLLPHEDTFAENNLLSRGQEIAVEVEEEDAISAELQPGQMSLHHGRLFHASGPNTSDDRRIGLVARFIRPDTPAHSKDFAMVMRGADRVGNRVNVVPPPGSFTSEKLALYEEVLAAQTSALAEGLEGDKALYDGSKGQANG
ncbi:MAG: phytanoyl-CoA dioxygenase family protein [Paracoccaceae bacterium]